MKRWPARWGHSPETEKQPGIARPALRRRLLPLLSRLPLDNNRCELDLRTVVVGRKNHYGSKSEQGHARGGGLATLIETAGQLGLDEQRYLQWAARQGAGPQYSADAAPKCGQ